MDQGLKAQIHRYAEDREIDYMSAKNLGNAYGIEFANEKELVEFKQTIDRYLKTFQEDAFAQVEEACKKKGKKKEKIVKESYISESNYKDDSYKEGQKFAEKALKELNITKDSKSSDVFADAMPIIKKYINDLPFNYPHSSQSDERFWLGVSHRIKQEIKSLKSMSESYISESNYKDDSYKEGQKFAEKALKQLDIDKDSKSSDVFHDAMPIIKKYLNDLPFNYPHSSQSDERFWLGVSHRIKQEIKSLKSMSESYDVESFADKEDDLVGGFQPKKKGGKNPVEKLDDKRYKRKVSRVASKRQYTEGISLDDMFRI